MNTYCDALMEVTERPCVTMVSGSGSWLVDNYGNRYLDFVQGWAVNCLGHAPEIIAQAAAAQARKLISCSPAYYSEPMISLANLLCQLSGLDKVFFANCGAEANEGAIKLARKYGEKYRDGAYEIITLDNSFHGRTLATMSASGKTAWKDLFEPKLPGFKKIAINDIAAMEQAIGPRTIAVMLEPIQGEAGVVSATREYLRALRELTRERGVLLILDEIQTGIGRTGSLFAYQRLGIKPDIVTLGKGLGGGVPLAALLSTREVSCFDKGDQGGTFSGNPLTTAIGYSVLAEVSKPEFLQNVESAGNYLRGRLMQLSKKFGLGGVRGEGLLLALEIPAGNAEAIAQAAFESGLLVNATRPTVLRFMPALNVSHEEIDLMVEKLEAILLSHSK